MMLICKFIAVELLRSGQYIHGYTVIAILSQTMINFVLFHFQIFIQQEICWNSSGITDGFSMCGGDFIEVYSDPSQIGVWDAVVTCFFIDTAHNIVEYIEIISRILKDEGVWINLGPLLYHFADMYNQDDEMSIELSLEDVKRVACHYGFEIEKESTIATTYTTNMRSMMQNRYYAAFWTMRKKPLVLRTHDAQ
ncbi:S-adenosyl-L-methionine-dependentmethyltransferases superfamily protein [Striga asiatica]|uniref:S-adenosyl-L-methionine-dependentmethyltransferases superfamily protein n=1 Tax=Striga asiatica TaxID=4170 RepID=A0A5A7QEM4_STRAF|nr:S-adenosyl-L-methionine-dependentmethyltransferases superfamily protein [Striga asiatica]